MTENITIKSSTTCPCCGVECTVGNDDKNGTHYYIPQRTTLSMVEVFEILTENGIDNQTAGITALDIYTAGLRKG